MQRNTKNKINLNKLVNKSKKIIPGGGTSLFSKIPENFIKKGWPSFFSKTKGIYLWDLNNKKYLDFYFGVGQNILGYNDLDIDKKVMETVKNGNMSSLSCKEEFELAEKLIKIDSWADMCRFARTGGEANSIAIRIARAASRKDKIAICGYHGWHDWYIAANLNNTNTLNKLLMEGLVPKGVPRVLKNTIKTFQYNDIKSFYNAVKDNDVGVVKMEVMRSELPQNFFLNEVREICNKKKIILIFDECTTGFREKFGGLYKKFNVIPDIVVYGKALGNGYAITSISGKGSVMKHCNQTFVSSTFWTERIGYVAALATLKKMEKIKSWKKITSYGQNIKKCWEEKSRKYQIDIDIKGVDALPLLIFKGKNNLNYKTLMTLEMLKKNILASNVVFTSILHNEKYLNKYSIVVDKVFEKINQIGSNRKYLNKAINGLVCNSGFGRLN